MPNRVIKESIWTSRNLNALSPEAERHFYRLIPVPDDHGCLESSPMIIKGKCYPLKEAITAEAIQTWQNELEEQDLLYRWSANGREYGILPKMAKHQRVRSLHQRKTPEPPQAIIDKVLHLLNGDSEWCQSPSLDSKGQPTPSLAVTPRHSHLNPNPNPNPNLSKKSKKQKVLKNIAKSN